jgi:polyisoprenoid-binding protein YceI
MDRLRATTCLLALALAASPAGAEGGVFEVDTSASTLSVHTQKAGVLSAISHNHRFTPDQWQGAAQLDPARPDALQVRIVVEARSLHDHEERLGAESRARVDEEAAGPKVLDVKHYPEIRFEAGPGATVRPGPDRQLEGVLHGSLTLHGATRPIDVPFQARPDGAAYRASGSVRFKQTTFGMTPYTAAMGTIGVDDEVLIQFDLVLRPAAGSGPPASFSRAPER